MTELKELYEEIENVFDNFDLCDASHIEGEDAADNALLLVRIKQAFETTTEREKALVDALEVASDTISLIVALSIKPHGEITNSVCAERIAETHIKLKQVLSQHKKGEPKFIPRDIHGRAYSDEEPLGDCEECDTKDDEIKALVDALEYVFNIAGGTSLEESEDALIAIQTQVTKVLSQHKENG